jgi:hypothetical protein
MGGAELPQTAFELVQDVIRLTHRRQVECVGKHSGLDSHIHRARLFFLRIDMPM